MACQETPTGHRSRRAGAARAIEHYVGVMHDPFVAGTLLNGGDVLCLFKLERNDEVAEKIVGRSLAA